MKQYIIEVPEVDDPAFGDRPVEVVRILDEFRKAVETDYPEINIFLSLYAIDWLRSRMRRAESIDFFACLTEAIAAAGFESARVDKISEINTQLTEQNNAQYFRFLKMSSLIDRLRQILTRICVDAGRSAEQALLLGISYEQVIAKVPPGMANPNIADLSKLYKQVLEFAANAEHVRFDADRALAKIYSELPEISTNRTNPR